MISLRNPRCVFKVYHLIAQDIGKKMDYNSIIIKTGSELDYNLILYLVLDKVYSASFGSNFHQINQHQ